MSDPNYFSQCSWENQWECNWKHYFFVTWRSKKKEGLGMEILQLKWAHRKMDELPDLGCLIWWQASKMFWVIFALCSQPHLFLCRIYIQSRKLYISFIYFFFIWRSMSVYICAQLSNDVRNIPVKASSVCICVCAVWVCSSATRCCVLLLLSCCHRNIVVAKLLLLPSYLISCSPFPQWLRTRPLPTHVSPITPTGCWWFCSSMVEQKIDPCRLTFK